MFIEISKIDAAKRQLETAVSLYFKNGEPVSRHTLTAAAHQILLDLGKLAGISSIIKDATLILIKPEMKNEYLRMVSSAENFLKHADRDPHELLKFNSEQTDILLFDAVEMYMQIAKKQPEDLSIYRVWFLLNHQYLIVDETRKKLEASNLDYVNCSRTTNKTDFYLNIKSSLMRQ